jgi:hypothetical protein
MEKRFGSLSRFFRFGTGCPLCGADAAGDMPKMSIMKSAWRYRLFVMWF